MAPSTATDQPLDPLGVPLSGVCLIEASAGTYSLVNGELILQNAILLLTGIALCNMIQIATNTTNTKAKYLQRTRQRQRSEQQQRARQ